MNNALKTDMVPETDIMDIKLRDQHFRVNKGFKGRFWEKVLTSGWEPGTLYLLDTLLNEKTLFVDCGAWIGVTTLFAGTKNVAAIHSYECDPVSLPGLRKNIALNPSFADKIQLFPVALSDHDGTLELFSTDIGNSQTSIFNVWERQDGLVEGKKNITVECRDVAALFREKNYLSNPDCFVKIDIEGSEYRILPHMAEDIASSVCDYYVSFHPHKMNFPDPLLTQVSRIEATMAWMRIFWNFNWYSIGSDHLSLLDKEQMLQSVLAGKTRKVFLFTRKTLHTA